jgi:hypothetical protein
MGPPRQWQIVAFGRSGDVQGAAPHFDGFAGLQPNREALSDPGHCPGHRPEPQRKRGALSDVWGVGVWDALQM